MKTLTLISRTLIVTIALTIGLVSCSKDDNDSPAAKNIVQVAQSDGQFSTLVAAIQKAGLTSTLEGAGPFTVFAPTNAAFNDLFAQLGVSGLADLSAEALKPILLNHVIVGSVKAADITTGYFSTANNSGPDNSNVKVFIQKASGVKVDKSNVTTADIIASNGVIHVVDKVILPASVVDQAINNPDFSVLVQAVVKAGLVEALSAPGPFTVFAPTNEAFNKLFVKLGVSGINDLTAEQLTPILLYHVVAGNINSSQVSSGSVPTLKEGSNIDIMVNTMGVNLNTTSKVVATDVQASNGIIHVIDEVLLP